MPALRAERDELLGETTLALTKYVRGHKSALPASWFQSQPPAEEPERTRLRKLAMRILKRRIADLFRKRSSLPDLIATDALTQDVVDPNAPKPERIILLNRMLEVTLSVLDGMRPDDRDLVALVSEDDDFRKALSPRERQRLHRVRKKLKREIASRLGAEPAELLRNTL